LPSLSIKIKDSAAFLTAIVSLFNRREEKAESGGDDGDGVV
jgi:hypothetical protein